MGSVLVDTRAGWGTRKGRRLRSERGCSIGYASTAGLLVSVCVCVCVCVCVFVYVCMCGTTGVTERVANSEINTSKSEAGLPPAESYARGGVAARLIHDHIKRQPV